MPKTPPPDPRSIDGPLRLMRDLRDPEAGCPWDRDQDHRSIAPYCIEEAYEVVDAIERGDDAALRDELGDLLLQVVFHARMAEERGAFDFADVCEALVGKMVRRHPHVYDDGAGVREGWEAIKAQERAARGEDESALSGVPVGLPALTRAEKLGKRASRTGFDWTERRDVLAKVREEVEEVEEALDGDEEHLASEVGDLLFACAMLTRKLGLHGETVLRAANEKFERRFRFLEARAGEDGRAMDAHTLEELEAYWREAKAEGL
jgi:MazG family protein